MVTVTGTNTCIASRSTITTTDVGEEASGEEATGEEAMAVATAVATA